MSKFQTTEVSNPNPVLQAVHTAGKVNCKVGFLWKPELGTDLSWGTMRSWSHGSRSFTEIACLDTSMGILASLLRDSSQSLCWSNSSGDSDSLIIFCSRLIQHDPFHCSLCWDSMLNKPRTKEKKRCKEGKGRGRNIFQMCLVRNQGRRQPSIWPPWGRTKGKKSRKRWRRRSLAVLSHSNHSGCMVWANWSSVLPCTPHYWYQDKLVQR